MNATARATDPSTSHEAAARMKGSRELEDVIAAVVRWYARPVTAEDIARHIVDVERSERWGHTTVLTAVSRVAHARRIVPAGTGLTSRGVKAIAYKAAP